MKLKRIKRQHVHFLSYWLAFVFLKAAWWIGAKFGSPSLEQIIFHFQNGTDGLADADPDIFRSFAIHVLFLPLLFAAILFALQEWINSSRVTRLINRYGTTIRVDDRLKRALALLAR